MTPPLFSAHDVRRSFDGRDVLKGVDLRADKGEVIGILGRNGAGKTTFFRVILGLLAGDSGAVHLNGREYDGEEIRRNVGYVPEHPVFHPWMTARDVFRFYSEFYPSWDMAVALRTAGSLSLPLDKRAGTFSKGGLAGLAWCCAVAPAPALLVLDEPTAALDGLVKDKVLDVLIGELIADGRTVLIAGNDMQDAFHITDRLAVLAGGRIQALHNTGYLRETSCHLTARLKEGASYRGAAPLLSAEGRTIALGVLGKEELQKTVSDNAFESMERRPMSPGEIIKTLLISSGSGEENI